MKNTSLESVNHPPHYGGKDSPYEAIKVIEQLGYGFAFCIGNALKYLSRARKKDSSKTIEDLEKACWYLDRAATNYFPTDHYKDPFLLQVDQVSAAWELSALLSQAPEKILHHTTPEDLMDATPLIKSECVVIQQVSPQQPNTPYRGVSTLKNTSSTALNLQI